MRAKRLAVLSARWLACPSAGKKELSWARCRLCLLPRLLGCQFPDQPLLVHPPALGWAPTLVPGATRSLPMGASDGTCTALSGFPCGTRPIRSVPPFENEITGPERLSNPPEFAQLPRTGAQMTTYQEGPSKRKIWGATQAAFSMQRAVMRNREQTYSKAPRGRTRTPGPWWRKSFRLGQ